ncbi:MAG: CHAT domain-containing protein, partial [Nannocystaceae bacterium]
VEWSRELLMDLVAVRQPGCDPAVVQRVGNLLATLMASARWPETAKQVSEALATGSVIVTVRSNAAELYMLPWELMTLPGTGQHLGALPGVVLRYEWPETASLVESPSPRSAGGRILLAFSGAGGSVPHVEHQQAIAAACRDGHFAFDPKFDVLADASISQIGTRLAAAAKAGTPYACLHVLCHGAEIGSTYGLALNAADTPGAHDPAGGAGEASGIGVAGVDKVDARRLRQCLVAHASSLRLVVVAACDGANVGGPGNQLGSVAQALHRAGIQAVIASRYPLSVAGSTVLTAALYNALLVETTSLEQGLARARTALMHHSATLDWASLQLYARAADGDDSRPFVFRPYRGLLAFQAAHSRFFYGREREQDEFVSDLDNLVAAKKPRLLVVTGASGSGKSSLVLSGLIPQLLARPERAGEPTLGPWEVATIRPGRHPSASLATALAGFDPLANSKLVIVDQFEELFTHTADLAARQKFASELWSLAADEASGVFVVLTIRVDF